MEIEHQRPVLRRRHVPGEQAQTVGRDQLDFARGAQADGADIRPLHVRKIDEAALDSVEHGGDADITDERKCEPAGESTRHHTTWALTPVTRSRSESCAHPSAAAA